jgi:hypothetical protein
MLTAALFIITVLWKQLRYPTTDEWIKKMWYLLHNGILLSHEEE